MDFRFEPLDYLLQSGLAMLGSNSWDECGNDKELFNYDPDWSRYARMEKADILRFVSVRENDNLVGYASIIITDNLHDKKICCAIIQDIFIMPKKRKGGTADRLLYFIEKLMMSINVKHISIAERLMVGNVGRWLSRKGYHCNERIWTKSLDARKVH